ncbi:putative Something about silencing protein 4 domain-containing protein [Seiridium cardinale]
MATTRRSTRSAPNAAEGRPTRALAQAQAQAQEDHAQAQPTHRHSARNYSAPATTAKHAAEPATDPTTRPRRRNSARMKRPLDIINPNPDPTKVKRSRIAVEIKSLAKLEPSNPPRTIVVRAPPAPSAVDVTTQQNKPPPSPPPSTTAAEPATQPETAQKLLTNHQKKVYNGIKHELDRLQPPVADAGPAKEQGRKLRSQEATRFKSELSAYFPDYDEVIGNDAKEHHALNVDTPILVVDSTASPHHNARTLHPRQAAPTSSQQHKHRSKGTIAHQDRGVSWKSNSEGYAIKSYGGGLYTNLYNAQRIDLPLLEGKYDVQDPLPDSLYETAHRRAERLEKSIRNTEKGRAQHEKDQIIRLLGELQGPDWLRTMGVNGVTESKKKTFESARNHFVKGCEAILDKFRWWTQEEKKRKLERDRAQAEEAASAEQEDEEEGQEEEAEDEIADSEEDEEMFDVESGNRDLADDSDGDPPDSSDVDAHIAKQLHEEALARVKRSSSLSHKRPRREPSPSPIPPPPPPPKEFKSFFEKRYDRDAALSKLRRSRRAVMAWGHNLPETMDEDFDLSEEYRDDETMQARERRKRRDRRGSRR